MLCAILANTSVYSIELPFDFDENSCIIFVGVIWRYGADGVNNLQVGKRRLCWKSETKDIDRQVERPRCDAANKIASRCLY